LKNNIAGALFFPDIGLVARINAVLAGSSVFGDVMVGQFGERVAAGR